MNQLRSLWDAIPARVRRFWPVLLLVPYLYRVLTTVPTDAVTTWAAPLIFSRQDFSLPPGEASSTSFECTVDQAWNLHSFLGHMHEWGKKFEPQAGASWGDVGSGALSPRSMRCSSSVASASRPARVGRVASPTMSCRSIAFTASCQRGRP